MSDKTLRLWVDGQCLQTASRMRGIGRYVQELLLAIAESHSTLDLHVSLNASLPDQAVAARDFLLRFMPPEKIHVWHSVAEGGEAIYGLTPKRLLSEEALRYHVQCIQPDVALSASVFEGAQDDAVPFLPDCNFNIPTAAIFYDAIPLRFRDRYLPDISSTEYYKRRLESFRNFDFSLCISSFAKNELKDILDIDTSMDISAGVSRHFLQKLCGPSKSSVRRNSLLYVGGFDWRKNVDSVVYAIALLNENLRSNLNFLVVGDLSQHTSEYIRSIWTKLKLPGENLHLVGHVSDDDLVDWYQTASAVIQPSFMEGFGLTALEAVLCGTPVIAAKAGALPEIIVDDRYLFDPSNVADIARHIESVIQSHEDGLTPEAVEHARQFSWERSALRAIDGLDHAVQLHKAGKKPSYRIKTDDVAARLRLLDLPIETIAGCMARAEVLSSEKRRLIVDATSTIITDGGTGIQRVVKKICANLPSTDSFQTVIAFSDNATDWFAVPDRRLDLGSEKTKQSGYRLDFTASDHILMLDSSWIFYSEHARSLRSARMRGAQVTTCLYDTVPIRASGFTHIGMPPVFSAWLKAALGYSTGFICISRAVADELIDLLEKIEFPRSLKIGYWPLGADFSQVNTNLRSLQRAERRHFLMVGTLEPRKGHSVALDAFDQLWKQGIDARLTIVGKKGWSADHLIDRMEAHSEWGKRLIWYKNATDDELQRHYADADCLVAASFAEGFGLPIVEAGHFGKPIIASDLPVFREVSAKSDDCRFFAVGNSQSLAECISSFIDNDDSKTAFTQAGQWESWNDSALRLTEVLLANNWYKTYMPRSERSFVDPSDIGNVASNQLLKDNDGCGRIEFVEGPLTADAAGMEKFIIKISNHSDAVWSSIGEFPIFVSVRLVENNNGKIIEKMELNIPFVITPSDSIYYSLEIPRTWLERGGSGIHIQMKQRGGPEFGNVIPLSAVVLQEPFQ